MRSDISQAFELQEKEHKSGKIMVAGTSCRMVSFKNFEDEIARNGLEIIEKEPSKEGKIGVEGINDDILLELFKKANISSQPIVINNPLTSVDMFTLELSGTPNAKQNKKKLLKSLDLPEFLSTSSLISYINSSMTKDEFYKYCDNLFTNL